MALLLRTVGWVGVSIVLSATSCATGNKGGSHRESFSRSVLLDFPMTIANSLATDGTSVVIAGSRLRNDDWHPCASSASLDGSVRWTQVLERQGAFNDVEVDTSGDVLCVGATGHPLLYAVRSDVLFVRIRADGEILDRREYALPGRLSTSCDVEIDEIGGRGLAIAGVTHTEDRGADLFVLRIDEAGGVIWQRRLGGNGRECLYDVGAKAVFLPDGTIIAVGSSSSAELTQRTDGSFLPYVAQLDGAGNLLREFCVDISEGHSAIVNGVKPNDRHGVVFSGVLECSGRFVGSIDLSGRLAWLWRENNGWAQGLPGFSSDRENGSFLIGNRTLSDSGETVGVVDRVSSTGDSIWSLTLADQGIVRVLDVQSLNGEFLVLGEHRRGNAQLIRCRPRASITVDLDSTAPVSRTDSRTSTRRPPDIVTQW